ncbi:neuronal growth regulator 1-like [Polypterus senegalus]|uniref:neuronal growth regulator 1-like n=1 Tax=Polypterus senegalus TaxID=55291 RepID=UPI001964FC63|nr:neuronal growth regulator 1-like [Polypterus senegalus]
MPLILTSAPFLLFRCYLADVTSKGAWLNRSSIIFAGEDKWSVDPRVSIVSSIGSKREYSLQIQNVDITDDGQYTCSVQTQHNPRTVQIYLTVQVPPKICEISPNVVVNEGSNVTLFCQAKGKPEPSISWRHITPSAKKTETGEYLVITSITRDQSGEYECRAENEVAFSDIKKVKVTVNYPPIILEMKLTGMGLGRPGLIRCETAAVPSPLFEWYKGEKKLFNGRQGITIQSYSTRSVLTVSNMTEDHYGNYTCVAINKLGAANASVPVMSVVHRSNHSTSERVPDFRFLGVHIMEDLSWGVNTAELAKKAQQRLNFLRIPQKLPVSFYHCSIESILCY